MCAGGIVQWKLPFRRLPTNRFAITPNCCKLVKSVLRRCHRRYSRLPLLERSISKGEQIVIVIPVKHVPCLKFIHLSPPNYQRVKFCITFVLQLLVRKYSLRFQYNTSTYIVKSAGNFHGDDFPIDA